MSVDPFHEVQQDIQRSLQSALNLRASYRRIKSTARDDSEELDYSRNELKATISALEADLDALEGSVRIVEDEGGHKYGIKEFEVVERRKYVQQVRREVEDFRTEVGSPESRRRYEDASSHPLSSTALNEDEDDQSEWARAEQQMIMRQQDNALDNISGALTTIAQQAGLIGQEVQEHNEILEDLERGVDRSDNKLNTAMKRMQQFIRQTEDTKSGWCIAILIAILCVLLLAVVLV